MIFYFYKITNTINGKFYYGVHQTNNIDDGYMGSGHALRAAYKKYGKNNFKKIILKYFDNAIDMYNYEKVIVNKHVVGDSMCYNLIEGGPSNIVNVRSLINRTVSDEARKKMSNSGKIRWNKMTKEERVEFGKKVSSSHSYVEHINRIRESGENAGYNNFDFVNRWKSIYDEDMSEICRMINNTNIPESIIIKCLFKKRVKVDRLIKYYQSKGLMGESIGFSNVSMFIERKDDKRGHKSTNVRKTIFSTTDIRVNVFFYIKYFFENIERLMEIEKDDSISDSMAVQGDNKFFLYRQMIDYFEEVGLIKNRRSAIVMVRKNVCGKVFSVKSSKTKFNFDFAAKTILIDKELVEYGIDNDGKPFQKGRFRLQQYGDK